MTRIGYWKWEWYKPYPCNMICKENKQEGIKHHMTLIMKIKWIFYCNVPNNGASSKRHTSLAHAKELPYFWKTLISQRWYFAYMNWNWRRHMGCYRPDHLMKDTKYIMLISSIHYAMPVLEVKRVVVGESQSFLFRLFITSCLEISTCIKPSYLPFHQ